MKEQVLKIIEELSAQKRNAKKFPVLVLDHELNKEIKRRVLKALRELFKEEKVDFGRTVNYNFVEIRQPDAPKRNRKVILHESDLLKDE
ncbi:MAG: hypothetical protein PVG07_00020 [Acidobacteriota bacterium]|jgi:hypothetical protein